MKDNYWKAATSNKQFYLIQGVSYAEQFVHMRCLARDTTFFANF